MERERGCEEVERSGRRARAVPHASRRARCLSLAYPQFLTFSSSTHSTPRLVSRAVFSRRKTWRTWGRKGEEGERERSQRANAKKKRKNAHLCVPSTTQCLLTSPVDRPVRPVRSPARDTSMHGKPAVTRSTPCGLKRGRVSERGTGDGGGRASSSLFPRHAMSLSLPYLRQGVQATNVRDQRGAGKVLGEDLGREW